MNAQQLSALTVAAAMAVLFTGCQKSQEDINVECAKIKKVDPEKDAEIIRKCFRAGKFTPSPQKSY
jgi:entry exclusion lipoprotein TrbK